MSSDDNWISITTQYDNTCMLCGGDILKDDTILWSKGTGVKHTTCPQKEESGLFIIDDTPVDWKDSKRYGYAELQKISSCQKCGKDTTTEPDSYIDDDRRLCSSCYCVKSS